MRTAVTLSALCAAALGLLFLFAPQEMSSRLGSDAEDGSIGSLFGAALVGFGAMNWVARGSALGGIYGRAVVVANQTHLAIGALVLLNHVFSGRSVTPGLWAVTALYVAGASFFTYLMFFSSGIRDR